MYDMPIIKSAIKKMKQDKVRTARNKKYEETYKSTVRQLKKGAKSLDEAYSTIDKAAKKKVIHPKKAGRLKALASKIAPKRKK